ncbi:MAG: Periplasmic murein peptide-binding protein [Opitutia bacterium UBA7350]|nr:MAG: Periplasmic murein peptide-binding protein [Opitutae bacterium UBA7350]
MLSFVLINRRVLKILLYLPFVALACCTKHQTNVERGNLNGELYVGIGAEPAALDPHLTTGLTEYSVMLALLEGLTTLHPETMAVQPGVARSWSVSEDGLSYTFNFDPNARWSNGESVTPQDFIFSFKRILSPELGAPYAYMLYLMRGAEAYNRGEIKNFAAVGVRAPDSKTLVIDLISPTPYFLSMLSHNTWWPVHPPTILAHGSMTDRISKWTKPGNFVGNGPFLINRWHLNNGIHAVRNPHYREHPKVSLNGIHFLPIAIQSEERAFRSGHLHITSSVPIHRIDWYKANQPESLRIDTALGVYYYMLNTERGPLQDSRVRQALAYSIDRSKLTEHVLKAGQAPAFHFTPPGTGGYHARTRLPFDPALARQKLAQAGFPEGKGFPKLQLLFNTSESHRTLAVAIQQMWKKELGIEIELHNKEWKAYLATRQSGDFDILRAAWYGDYDDPNTFLSLGESHNGNNHTNWHNPRYDALIAEAARETNLQIRHELFQEAEDLLIDALPVIPIYFYVTSRLIDSSVKGWFPSILDNHPYQAVNLEN